MLLPAVALVSTLSERSPLPDCLAPIPIAQAPLIQIHRPPSGEEGEPEVQLMLVTVPPGVRAGELIYVSARGQLFMATVPGDLGPLRWCGAGGVGQVVWGRQFQIGIPFDRIAAAQAAEEAAAREAAAVQETAAQEAAAAEEAAAQEAAASAREAVLAERKKKKALAEQERRAANARAAGRPVGVAGNPNFRKAGKQTEGCENDAPHDSMDMDTHGT